MLSETLKKLRESKGLYQKEVASDLGISNNTLCAYEKGRREPDLEMTIKLANYYDVSVDYLLNSKNKITSISGLDHLKAFLVEYKVIKKDDIVTEEMAKRIAKLLKNMDDYYKD